MARAWALVCFRTMASNAPAAKIRPFEAADEKLVRFKIAKAQMEVLATANTTGEYIDMQLQILKSQ